MTEINNIGARIAGLSPDNNQTVMQPAKQSTGENVRHAPADALLAWGAGSVGQPVGLAAPIMPGQTQILTDALVGREATQLRAAEQLRDFGGAAATEQLLRLNLQPSCGGAFPPPPGHEALHYLPPAVRRGLMISLLAKRRVRLRQLARLLRDHEPSDPEGDNRNEPFEEPITAVSPLPSEEQRDRARRELKSVARMLDLLDELLMVQEYTLSQMGALLEG
ncbi:MAG: hypothetical protein WKF30_02260 [Pyrinomonadaceae bacterium]